MRSNPRFNAVNQAIISCIPCTGRQVTELHCYYCDMDKGLDKFSKAQRKTPDHAVRQLQFWLERDCADYQSDLLEVR